jgi:hypothetical protein
MTVETRLKREAPFFSVVLANAVTSGPAAALIILVFRALRESFLLQTETPNNDN